MTLQDLLKDAPLLHRGGTATLQLSDETLAWIDGCINESSRTLETGAGVSTVLFALKGAEHTCVTCTRDEVDAITRYCSSRGISLERTRFHVDKSTRVLPSLTLPDLDVVLIDGGHGFPDAHHRLVLHRTRAEGRRHAAD